MAEDAPKDGGYAKTGDGRREVVAWIDDPRSRNGTVKPLWSAEATASLSDLNGFNELNI